MLNSKPFLAALAALMLVQVSYPENARAKKVVDRVAIVVNDSVVTLSEYRQKEERIKRRKPETSKDEIVNTVISEILIEQAAARNEISVSKQEMQDSLNEMKKSLELDDEGFVQMLAEKNTSFKEFFADMRLQILTRKLVQSEIARRGISIDDEKVEQVYMKINPDASRAPQVRIAHILMPDESERSLADAKEVARRAKSGEEDFAALAKEHSVDIRTSDKGGDLGYFEYGELITALQKAVEGAGVGDINGPVRSKAGFHIVRVLAIKREGVLVPPEIKNVLIEEMAMQETERIISSVIESGFEASHIEIKI